jgi:hypothetical protein
MQVLIDTKKEYIKCTQSVLSIPIAEKINNLYELSVADSSGLKGFQNRLNKISQWNNLTIANEYKRIKKNSKYKNIEQIYNTIININIQIKLGDYLNDINNLNISYTSFQDFIHLCYVNVSIWVWKNPYLFFKHNLKQTEIQFNYNLIEKNINKIIKHTITEVTPIDTIMEKLDEYKKPLTTKIFTKFNNFITKNKSKNNNSHKETYDNDLNYNERDYQVINNNTIEKSDDEIYINNAQSIENNGIESSEYVDNNDEDNNDKDTCIDVIENNDNDADESDNDNDNILNMSDIGNDIDNENDADESNNYINNEIVASESDNDIDNKNDAGESDNDIDNKNDAGESDNYIDNKNDAGESDNDIDNKNDVGESDNDIDNKNDAGESDNDIDNGGNTEYGNYNIKNKFLSDTDNISSDNSDASSSSSENSNKKIYIKTRKKMY